MTEAKSRSERGAFRAIHTVLVDTPEFQELSFEAQAVWFNLRLRLGSSGIGVVHGLAEAMGKGSREGPERVPEGSAKGPERVSIGINELSAGEKPWLIVARNVYWLRNALRFEPSISLSHQKQRIGIENYLKTLPKLNIVNDFADYYEIALPFPELRVPKGSRKGPVSLSEGSREGRVTTEEGRLKSDTETTSVVSQPSAKEKPKEGEASTGALDEEMTWKQFAAWFRETGHRALWGGESPPDDAARPNGSAWRIVDELSICKRMYEQQRPLAEIKAVICHPGQGPRTMKWYWERGAGQRYNEILGAVHKRIPPADLGEIEVQVAR